MFIERERVSIRKEGEGSIHKGERWLTQVVKNSTFNKVGSNILPNLECII